MQEWTDAELERGISLARLSSYMADGCSRELALRRYEWNLSLSEAFYPLLPSIEVGLRNSLHTAISLAEKNDDWALAGALLAEAEARDVQSAARRLQREAKPTDAGHVVAAMTFGFWTSLLDRRTNRCFGPAS